jgi:hypothetical protein
MALANIAWILASNGKRVLAIDWDLEAPGLHRYFGPFLIDEGMTATEGIIDFVSAFAIEALTPSKDNTVDPNWYRPHADVSRYAVSVEFEFASAGSIDFIPAGKQGPSYATRVTSFNYENFYDRLGGGVFLDAAKEKMHEDYHYVLIDSRTGVSDTSGICTLQMPDVLVVCYTLNNQSIAGSAAVAAYVDMERQRMKSHSPLRIFPVPMRVDNAETDKLKLRREFSKRKFSPFLSSLPEDQENQYWGEIEVPYVPYYAYEEVLATFRDEAGNRNSVLAAMESLCGHLTNGEVTRLAPASEDDRKLILQRFENRMGVAESFSNEPGHRLLNAANDLFAKLSLDDQDIARRVLTRAVEVTEFDPPVPNARQALDVRELGLYERRVLRALVGARLMIREKGLNTEVVKVRLAHDALLEWPRLRDWITEHGQFFVWRQQLRRRLAQWQRTRDPEHLLQGVHLTEALQWRGAMGSELNRSELEFLDRSAGSPVPAAWSYKAFLSYAHSDVPLAKILSGEINQFARDLFHEKQILFDSATQPAAVPDISQSVRWALSKSEYFVLLASPEAASSTQVSNELEAWLTERPPENLLIVLSEGTIVWDAFNDDFDWSATTAVPKTLASAFWEAPIWFDLKWANRGVVLLPLDPRLRQEVTRLTASLYDRSVEDLFTRDSKRRKRLFWRLRTGIFGLAAVFLLSLLVLLFGAIPSCQRAEATRKVAEDERKAAAAACKTAEDKYQVAEAARKTAVNKHEQAEAALNHAVAHSKDLQKKIDELELSQVKRPQPRKP